MKEQLEGLIQWLMKIGRENVAIIFMYQVSTLGALSKSFFDATLAGDEFQISAKLVMFALIVSAVTFPLIFDIVRNIQRGEDRPNVLAYFVAYQSGFFWQSLLIQLY